MPPLPSLAQSTQICGRGDTVEALTHVLAQQRRVTTNPRSDAAVASVDPGTGRPSGDTTGIPSPPPQPLSEDDFAKVKAAVRDRDDPKPLVSSTLLPATSGKGQPASPTAVPVPSSPSPREQHQPQQSRWSSAGLGGGVDGIFAEKGGEDAAAAAAASLAVSGGGIDQRLFAPVLRAILAGEGDHVLRRSLLCHPFLKAKNAASSTGGSGGSWGGGSGGGPKASGAGASVEPSPQGSGRRKGSKGAKGGKAKKRDRDRGRDVEEFAQAAGAMAAATSAVVAGSPSSRGAAAAAMVVDQLQPLDVSREMNRLAERAAADGSLQSTLILIKTLLCAVDPATQLPAAAESPRQASLQQGARPGRKQASAKPGPGTANASSLPGGRLALRTAPLRALAVKGLSGWSDVMKLLRREKYRELMMSLRGRPSLTVCCGKAEMRGRLEAKGESSGVLTGARVSIVS